MFGFMNNSKRPSGPPALSLQDQKLYELEMRILGLEEAILVLCDNLKANFDRIDENTTMLDKNMHKLATLTLRPPKDLLDGGREPN